jgi:hypothetical protein
MRPGETAPAARDSREAPIVVKVLDEAFEGLDRCGEPGTEEGT